MTALESQNLPVIESCDGCSACCSVQGAPPDYVALSLNPHFREDPSFAEDVARFDALDGVPKDLLEEYLTASARGCIPKDDVCVWLDQKSNRCRFYELRPSNCRVFELSSPGCHYYRKHAKVVPVGYAIPGEGSTASGAAGSILD